MDLVTTLRFIQILFAVLCFVSGLFLLIGPELFLRLSNKLNRPVASIEGLRSFLDREIPTKKLESILDNDISTERLREKLDRTIVIDKEVFELRYYIGMVAIITGLILLWSYMSR